MAKLLNMMLGSASPFATSTQNDTINDTSGSHSTHNDTSGSIILTQNTPKLTPVSIPSPIPTVTDSPQLAPRELFPGDSTGSEHSESLVTAEDRKLAGEVSGLIHINNDPVTDRTATTEADKEDPPNPSAPVIDQGTTSKSCKGDNCDAPDSSQMLKCKECNGLFHYSCTGLPRYFVYILVHKKRAFSCSKCYDVPDDFMPDFVKHAGETLNEADQSPNISHLITTLEKSLLDGMSSRLAEFERTTVAAINTDKTEAASSIIASKKEEIKSLNASKSRTERDLHDARKLIDIQEKSLTELRKEVEEFKDLQRQHIGLKLVLDEEQAKSLAEKEAVEQASAKTIQELVDRHDAKLVSFTELKTQLGRVETELKTYKERCESLQTELLKEKIHNESSSATGTFADVTTEQPEKHTSQQNVSKPDAHTGEKPSAHNEPDIYLLGNSLTSPLRPKELFNPLFTKIHTLGKDKKNLEGALEHLDQCSDIKPKSVILHVVENNISKDQPEEVLKKLNLVVEKAKTKFPAANVFVVEPIGRGDSSYNRNVQAVRDGLSRVVDSDRIVKTDELHTVSEKLFVNDQVHLKGRGIGLLCSAYKRAVYPCHGVSYEPLRREALPDRHVPHRREALPGRNVSYGRNTFPSDRHVSHRREALPERNVSLGRNTFQSGNTRGRARNFGGSSSMETDFFDHMRQYFMNQY